MCHTLGVWICTAPCISNTELFNRSAVTVTGFSRGNFHWEKFIFAEYEEKYAKLRNEVHNMCNVIHVCICVCAF